MYRTLVCFVCFLISCHVAFCQTPQPTSPDFSVKISEKREVVEIEAAFPGGLEAWRKYLVKNLKVGIPLKKKAPKGSYMVIARFIVSKDGSISAIEPETSHGYGMEEEVIRIIKKSPKWIPAMQNGHPVNAYRRQPITFLITGK